MLANVDLPSGGGPSANGADGVAGYASKSQGGGTSCSHGVATDIG